MQTMRTFSTQERKSEQAFKAVGLASYFDTDEDNDVDWEELFDVKAK